ncbi:MULTISPECIES: hypothetical protein [unclassified Burkholderia]|uniref:hypothetical protein n=1 Tax=unclassified Burkholderia TaxID=2613784 RepID=UPI000F566E90|nr:MULTISPECIES: hypothetical protein [unclassified Burkholderia]
MAYQFVATRSVELTGLRFPFPLKWYAERGFLRISNEGRGELLFQGGNADVRVEESFDIRMTPDETGAVAGRLELDLTVKSALTEPEWGDLAAAYSGSRRGFGVALTQNMFQLPRYAWTLEKVASKLDIKPRALQMTLFRECYSFDSALRRCRQLDMLLQEGNSYCDCLIFERVAEKQVSYALKQA